MKSIFKIFAMICFFVTIMLSLSNLDNGVNAQSSNWQMPEPRYCPESLMYATDCSAAGMGCITVQCKIIIN